MAKRKKGRQVNPADKNFNEGLELIRKHPMFAPLATHASIYRHTEGRYPKDGWAYVSADGNIYCHPKRLAQPEEWVYVLAHCLLHLGMGHFSKRKLDDNWNRACDCYVAKFLEDMKLGRPPYNVFSPIGLPRRNEQDLYEYFCENEVPKSLLGLGTAGYDLTDMLPKQNDGWRYSDQDIKWGDVFGRGLAMAVKKAVNVAAGYDKSMYEDGTKYSLAERMRSWFISSYPLLGSLAADFKIIEDPIICQRLQISVAAVDEESKEIFINPAAGMGEQAMKFVMAHELLHVGLRHQGRCAGRDPYLWNVACDYVINGWLIEMDLGDIPEFGGLYDPELKGLSAESIYDRIVTDIRRFKKLATFRGIGLGDMIRTQRRDWQSLGHGVDLDEFYCNCLGQGLVYHEDQDRGYLPLGLVEEIRSLSQPPIPWDVELAEWFDDHFSPIEKRRTYARPSRRQSSTPDIPRPRWVPAKGAEDGRTFGVVLDTSGSMDRKLLAKALGAIASYSMSRDVPAVRVIFCDAHAYDQGYMKPEDIAETVKVKGRGGTILQPAIDLLNKATDFPKDGSLLVITDGFCDRLSINREHALLIPQGRNLPFVPKGRVFRVK